MRAPTLAQKLGITARPSALLRKAQALGLADAMTLEQLAVARGCWHYRQPEMPDAPDVDESQFSNEELAIALLSPSLPYSSHAIRLGAAMLGATDNDMEKIIRLAAVENCEMTVRYIAKSGRKFEPENVFWSRLLESLPETGEPPDGVLPHPTRFVEMTGIDRGKIGLFTRWIRPHEVVSA